MKIGIHYTRRMSSLAAFLYALGNDKIEFDQEFIDVYSIGQPIDFKITTNEHEFYFAETLENIKGCDIKVASWDIDDYDEKMIADIIHLYDYVFLVRTNGEVGHLPHEPGIGHPDLYNRFFQFPNVYFIISYDEKKYKGHEKFISDKAINLFYFYSIFGYFNLNYYPLPKKYNLLGVYNRYNKYKPHRSQILDDIEKHTGIVPHVFRGNSDFDLDITKKLFDKWSKDGVHITSYTDYNSCVVNLLFESQYGVFPAQDSLTEKTLKSIIFQKADIFFIHCGSVNEFEWLQSKGFWFLNTEFYDTAESDQNAESAVYHSVIKACKYLKELKDALGTDDAVYQHLIEKYGNKLKSSIQAFSDLIKNCEYKDRLINLIVKGNL